MDRLHPDPNRSRQAPASRPGQRGGIGWFLLVGCTAAGVHWSIVVALVRLAGWPPLVANVVGWLMAFGVSFTGHHLLSFRGHGATVRSSAQRFLLLSAGGFAINETAYAVLLQVGGWRFDAVLAVVLAAVAVVTYLLSRHWAFPGSPGP